MPMNPHANQVPQDRISAAVWLWRDREQKQIERETGRRRRQSLIQASFMLTAGIVMCLLKFFVSGSIAVSLAAIVYVSGRLVPRFYDALNGGVTATGRACGLFVTWVLLVPLFYLCFLPGRLILLARRRDPMERKFPTNHKTYWVPRPPRHPGHFEQQY